MEDLFRFGDEFGPAKIVHIHEPSTGLKAIVVIDCQMPGIGGLDLVDRLTSNGTHAPVILMTGNCGRSAMIRARRAGVVAILEKPFSDELLLDSIHRAL